MTRYAFTLNIDDLLQVDGWAEFRVLYDMDDEAQGIDVEAIEIGTDLMRDREIQRGDAIRDNLPDDRFWDEVRLRVWEHLNDEAGAWQDCLDAAERQGDLPESHPTAWLFGANA